MWGWLYSADPLGFGIAAFVLGVGIAVSYFFGVVFETTSALTGGHRLRSMIVAASSAVIGGSVLYLSFLGNYGAYVPSYMTIGAILYLIVTAYIFLMTIRDTPATLPRLFYAFACAVALGCVCSMGDLRYVTDAWALGITVTWFVVVGIAAFGAVTSIKRCRRRHDARRILGL